MTVILAIVHRPKFS